MNPNFKLNLLTLSLLAITSIAHAEDEVSTQELDEIQVKGKHIAKEKKVFTEPERYKNGLTAERALVRYMVTATVMSSKTIK